MKSVRILYLSGLALIISFAGVTPSALTTPVDPAPLAWERHAGLMPFIGTYAAYYRGKPAGDATLRLRKLEGQRWEVVMDVHGNRGVVGVLGLNLTQKTVFDLREDGQFRPVSQSTIRKGLFLGKSISGQYNWATHVATWQGDIDKKRRAPVPLQDGDMSALLINLAVVRDAAPGVQLSYRFADVGRARLYQYQANDALDTVAIQDLSYAALHLRRTNNRPGDAMEFWIAPGIPTPIRIAQQEDGQPGIDLQLIEYEGG